MRPPRHQSYGANVRRRSLPILFILSTAAACGSNERTQAIDGNGDGRPRVGLDGGSVVRPSCPPFCTPPFSCSAETSPQCTTESLAGPTCRGRPEGSPLAVQLTDIGIPLHWLVGSCIPVTFEPSLRSLEPIIIAALAEWAATDCTSLCFAGPIEALNPPDVSTAERRLHFRGAFPAEPVTTIVATTTFERATGRMVSAEVLVSLNVLDQVGPGDVLSMLLRASGFEPDDRVIGESPPVLTGDQRAALCALYGEPPFCDADLRAP